MCGLVSDVSSELESGLNINRLTVKGLYYACETTFYHALQNLGYGCSTSLRKRGLNEQNVFCYICGEYTLEQNRKAFNDFIRRAYFNDFKVMLEIQDKSGAQNIVCKPRAEHLP